jgi:hypothetical protein
LSSSLSFFLPMSRAQKTTVCDATTVL